MLPENRSVPQNQSRAVGSSSSLIASGRDSASSARAWNS